MTENFFKWVIKHPVIVIAITLAFVLVTGAGLPRLSFTGDYRVYFSEDNPQLIAYETMQSAYSKSDSVSFLILPEDGDLMTPQLLESIRKLTDDAWQVPFSTRVDSISNFQYTYAEGDDLIVRDLISDETSFNQEELDEIQQIAINEPQLINKFISPESHATLVNVTINMPGVDVVSEEPQVTEKVRSLKAAFEVNNPGVTVHLSGVVMMSAAAAEAAITDNTTLVPLMLLIVIITIGILLRTVSGTASLLIIIIISILSTMGLAGWAGISLTGGSASAPIMILTLVVADCVHVMTTLIYEMRRGLSHKDAMLRSLQVNFQPIFLTSATTAIGFLSMNFSDSPPFNDLGNMVAVGVMLAFLFSVTTFPAILSLLPHKVKVKEELSNDLMDRLAEFVIRRKRLLLPLMSIIILALGIFATQNRLNDDPVRYFAESTAFRQATDAQQEYLSGMKIVEISVDGGSSSSINSPEFIAILERFTYWLRDQPEVDHVNSLSDTFKRLNKNMHGDDEQWYRLPDSRELAAQYLLMYEMSLPYGLDLNNQINVDKSATRVVATMQNLDSTSLLDIERRINGWFENNESNINVSITGPDIMFAHIAQRNIVSMLFSTLIALILISLLLGFALKSVRYCVLSLIPNITPAFVGFGIWGLWNGEINLGLSLVVGITLGIVVDNTVHFLSKYLRARREQGESAEQATRYAFANVGRALYITTSVLFLGFMCLAQSQFTLNADMGLLTAVIIVIALIIDFLLLPPLLMRCDSFLHPEHGSAKA
ncbi:MAG: putative RND superfamily exporter protein [Porticoccaceae bacterium]|jgi:predicted RND superfamily exporter protein